MGQPEILEFFEWRASRGLNEFLCFSEIKEGMRINGYPVCYQSLFMQLKKLEKAGFLETNEHERFVIRKGYRLKTNTH